MASKLYFRVYCSGFIIMKLMKYLSRIAAVIVLLFLIKAAEAKDVHRNVTFDKSFFYNILSGSKQTDIDKLIAEVKASAMPEKTAYEGALLMKKAGLLAKPKDKLKVFKQGKALLEEAIKTDDGNVEYHFLRLIIQENAPKILNYKAELPADSKVVKDLFFKLVPAVQKVVKDYSKTSKVISPTDF